MLEYTGEDKDYLGWEERLDQYLKGKHSLLYLTAKGLIEPPVGVESVTAKD